jgi:hypothetical protein
VCSSAGSVNNNFLGDVRVYTLYPSGVGTTSGLARTGGSVAGNYTAVNENPPDGDTSYNSTNVVGTYDTYQYDDLPVNVTSVLAVASSYDYRRDDAGFRQMTTRVRSGGTEADFPNPVTIGSGYAIVQQIAETNPVSAGAWTLATVNAAELGPKLAV